MKDFLRRGARAAAGLVLSASAVVFNFAPGPADAAAVVRDPVIAEQARASMQAAITASRAAAATRRLPGHGPSDVIANPYRAYPPSCLADSAGVPFGNIPSTPAPFQKTLLLPGDIYSSNTSEQNYTETVTITLWRVPCSRDSNGNPQSATVIEIDRSCGLNCANSLYPTFPLIEVTQGQNSNISVRLAEDQNTWFSTTFVNSPIFSSSSWVLENYFNSDVQFDFNQAFSISFDRTIQFSVPAYNPAQYPSASQPLPISGYMTSNWYSPGHGGEGILTQVFDNSDGATRTFTAAWYTFGTDGLPFWLFAQGVFNIGATTTGPVDTYYPTGGFFASSGGAAAFTKWGTVTFSFPDCGHMLFSYNGASGANAPIGPSGQGQLNWIRIANVNNIVCD